MAMDYPGSGDVHVNALLTNMSIRFENELYIAEGILPNVLVNKRSDIVPKYFQSDWYRRRGKYLGEREPAPVGGYRVDVTDTYFCNEVGVGTFIGDARRANTDQPYDADRDGMRWVVDGILLEKEFRFTEDFWKTGVWGTDKTGTVDFTKWSVYATSTPIANLRSFIRTVRRATGRQPNKLVLGDLTFDVLVDHPNFLDRIKYGQTPGVPAMVTPQAMAAILGLDEILIGLSQYTTSNAATAEASVVYTPMWDDDALLLYVPSGPSLGTPAAGYTFVWRTAFGGPRYIKQRRDPASDKGDLIEGYEFFDQKITAANAGLFISDAVD